MMMCFLWKRKINRAWEVIFCIRRGVCMCRKWPLGCQCRCFSIERLLRRLAMTLWCWICVELLEGRVCKLQIG